MDVGGMYEEKARPSLILDDFWTTLFVKNVKNFFYS